MRGTQAGVGVFFYNDMDHVILDNLHIENFSLGVQVAGANLPPKAGSDGQQENIDVMNSTIINNRSQGFLGGCTDCSLQDNYFENNGYNGHAGAPALDHNIYWSGGGNKLADGSLGAVSNGRISGNVSYRSAVVNGQCRGVSLVVHGIHDNLIIENNVIYEDPGKAHPGCWGIAVDGGYSTPESFKGLIIRKNKVINVGGMGIGCTGCYNAVVENNVIIHEHSVSLTAIKVPDKVTYPNIKQGNEASTTNVMVRNNSIYFGPQAGGGVGISVGEEGGKNYSILNNAIYYAGSSSSWSCFSMPNTLGSYDNMDHNTCYYPNTSGSWESGSGSLSSWRAASAFDANSSYVNPQFKSPLAPRFDLSIGSSNSPLVNAGHPSLSAADDYVSNPSIGQRDIGALELGSDGSGVQPPNSGGNDVTPPSKPLNLRVR